MYAKRDKQARHEALEVMATIAKINELDRFSHRLKIDGEWYTTADFMVSDLFSVFVAPLRVFVVEDAAYAKECYKHEWWAGLSVAKPVGCGKFLQDIREIAKNTRSRCDLKSVSDCRVGKTLADVNKFALTNSGKVAKPDQDGFYPLKFNLLDDDYFGYSLDEWVRRFVASKME